MQDSRLKLTVTPQEIETEAWNQIKNALNNPNLITLAIMPDIHTGYDLPIGGVALIQDHIWPGAVGYDIGCGMSHINTGLSPEKLGLMDKKDKKKLYKSILRAIPVGLSLRKEPIKNFQPFPNACNKNSVKEQVNAKAAKQLGTLGGGNHFIEIGLNSRDQIGITIHSGSRNPGHTIGDHYMKLAQVQGKKFGNSHMFPLGTQYGENYITDMKWAEKYALTNRKIIMQEILKILNLNTQNHLKQMINENHNHAIIDSDKNRVLHRKGATPADLDQLGIIPSNQRDGVYITRGLGNEEFLSSASHGAGRRLSRKKAKKQLSLQDFQKQMGEIVCKTEQKILDEAPESYKDIKTVLAEQEGVLVQVLDHFRPLIVVKG